MALDILGCPVARRWNLAHQAVKAFPEVFSACWNISFGKNFSISDGGCCGRLAVRKTRRGPGRTTRAHLTRGPQVPIGTRNGPCSTVVHLAVASPPTEHAASMYVTGATFGSLVRVI